MFTLIRRRIILSLSALLMVLSISVFPLSSEASAKTIQEMNISEASAAMGYYYALRFCVRDQMAGSDFNQESLDKNNFFGQQSVILGGQFITSDGDWDGIENCSSIKDKTAGEDSGWVRSAIATLGYSNSRDFLCHVMSGAGIGNYDSCRNGQGNLSTYEFAAKSKDQREAAFSATVGKRIFNETEPLNRPEGDAIMQNILYNTFYAFCQPIDHNGGTVGSDYKQLAVKQYQKGPPATYADKQVLVKTDRLNKTIGIIEASPEGMNRKLSCNELPGQISIFADRAKSDLRTLRTNFFDNANTGTGIVDDEGNSDSKSSCAVDGIGWIVCPALGFMSTISDQLFSFLATQFLSVDTRTVSTSSGTYVAWSAMRNIANVAFVIAFLIIIFSQLTSIGITAYGIKKMLPRLIVAAILVNMSFIICQIAVDLSNILGYGLKALFESVQARIAPASGGDATGNGFGIAIITTALLAGGITLAFALSVPVIGAVLLTLFVIIFILLARKALIVLLVVIAPLAFVAYLLPNTEQWFKKWQKMFFALLLVFPVIAVVFGASSLAAYIIKSTAAPGDNLTPLIAIGVAAIPLIIVPTLLKGSIAAAGAIGAVMKGWGDKSQNGIAGKVGSTSRLGQYSKYRKNEAEKRRALIQAGGYSGTNKNPLNWGRNATSRVNRAMNTSALSGKFGNRSAAMGVSLAEKIEDEEVSEAQKLMRAGVDPNDMITKASEGLAAAIDSGDVVKARAAQQILLNSGNQGLDTLYDTLSTKITTEAQKKSDVARNLRSELNQAGLKGKNNALAAWSYNDLGTNLNQTRDDNGTLEGLSDTELAGQSYKKVLNPHRSTGAISQAKAQSVIDNQNIWKDLSKEKQDLFVQLAGRAPYHPVGPTATPPPPPPPPPPLP